MPIMYRVVIQEIKEYEILVESTPGQIEGEVKRFENNHGTPLLAFTDLPGVLSSRCTKIWRKPQGEAEEMTVAESDRIRGIIAQYGK